MTRIFCFGGAHVDRTARCKAAFIPGASNPVAVETTLGGTALNTASNLKRLGGEVLLISAIGDDAAGAEVTRAMAQRGLPDDGLIRRRGQASANYTAILEDTGELVAGLADMGIYDGLSLEDILSAIKGLGKPPAPDDFAFFDANLPAAVLEELSASLASQGVVLAAAAVSPAKIGRLSSLLKNLDFLFCSKAELAAFAALDLQDEAKLHEAGRRISSEQELALFMTRGAGGLVLFNQGALSEHPALPAAVVDVNGAGDAFAAGTLHAMMRGGAIPDALGFGQAAACLTLETAGSTAGDLTPGRVFDRLGR